MEIQWLSAIVRSLDIKSEIKNDLLDTLFSALQNVDKAVYAISLGKSKLANNMLSSATKIIGAVQNQIEAQTGKALDEDLAGILLLNVNNIKSDLSAALTSP